MKTCKKCSEEKPLDRFPRDNRMVDGHRSECKDCKKLRENNYYHTKRKSSVNRAEGDKRMNLKITPEYEKLINDYMSGDY